MSAMGGALKSTTKRDEKWDPALSTRMFSVEKATTTNNNSGGGFSSSTSSSSAASRFDSSENGGNQAVAALDERMARLRRAQKLLEKSQPKVG